jgi:hypothetical protein
MVSARIMFVYVLKDLKVQLVKIKNAKMTASVGANSIMALVYA